MLTALRRAIMRALRVPDQPADPAGAPGSLLVFRAAPSYYRYLVVRWLLRQGVALVAALSGLLWFHGEVVSEVSAFGALEVLGLLALLAQTAYSFLALRIDYELRWYKVTDRSLRIREGVWAVREMTMTFANIQNIGVSRGPLQRLLGIADVEVQSAGGGGTASSDGGANAAQMHRAVFRGVDNAEQIRDLMRERLRLYRDSGLGDLDDTRAPAATATADERSAVLRGLRDEASALRRAAEALAEQRGRTPASTPSPTR